MFYAGCIVIGLTAGFLSALLGIGGGVVVVPMLLLFFAMDMKVAIGTSLAYIAPVALWGAFQHGLNRNVNLMVVALAVPLGFAGAYLGVRVCEALPALALKRVFGVVLLLVGLKLLLLPHGWEGIFGTTLRPGAEQSQAAAHVPPPTEAD